jgi:6-phosphogluconate dehydrogenase (decarboxylating)
MMVGGERVLVQRQEPTFLTLAPESGYVHCGARRSSASGSPE